MSVDREARLEYEAGADTTPVPEGSRKTPGQLWYKLLMMDPQQRLELLGMIQSFHDIGWRCVQEGHTDVIADLRAQVAAHVQAEHRRWVPQHGLDTIVNAPASVAAEPNQPLEQQERECWCVGPHHYLQSCPVVRESEGG